MTKENLEIEYACDADGDHTALMANCTESRVATFDNELKKQEFITQCTYVYNLDIALGNKVNADTPNPILDSIADCWI
jgi:hypothetical protein